MAASEAAAFLAAGAAFAAAGVSLFNVRQQIRLAHESEHRQWLRNHLLESLADLIRASQEYFEAVRSGYFEAPGTRSEAGEIVKTCGSISR